MEKRTFKQIWQTLEPEQKHELARRVGSTYTGLVYVAHRNGYCSRLMSREITRQMIAMKITSGSVDTLTRVIFHNAKRAPIDEKRVPA